MPKPRRIQEHGKFVKALLDWYQRVQRPLPWRTDQSPYRVWLSEIMLQQTRIETVKGYFDRFLATYPTVEQLAAGDDSTLFKLWEGLGYYARARNLKKAAQIIVEQGFPTTAKGWLELPGIGPYTAGAIASIAFNEPVAAVDGNVVRVLSRLLGRTYSREEATGLLANWIPPGRASDFTQAWMEAGELVCLPNGDPQCLLCPLQPWCQALATGRIAELPAPPEKRPRKVQELTVFLLCCQGRYALRQRPSTGLLARLWEYPNVPGKLDSQAAIAQLSAWSGGQTDADAMPSITPLPPSIHQFTHIEWRMTNYRVDMPKPLPLFQWVTPAELKDTYTVPTAFQTLRKLCVSPR
ncbi:MAG: A/G-specific adenine glycosylase [Victivallales bacterium]|nr:A/G-specific adenine glycosylase [Victivallales bacterium]